MYDGDKRLYSMQKNKPLKLKKVCLNGRFVLVNKRKMLSLSSVISTGRIDMGVYRMWKTQKKTTSRWG